MARKKKSEGGSFEKEPNPLRNADDVREYANELAERLAKMPFKLQSAASRMDELGPDFRVKFIVSMMPRLLKEIEDRLTNQFEKKLAREINKAKAQRLLQQIMAEQEKNT